MMWLKSAPLWRHGNHGEQRSDDHHRVEAGALPVAAAEMHPEPELIECQSQTASRVQPVTRLFHADESFLAHLFFLLRCDPVRRVASV